MAIKKPSMAKKSAIVAITWVVLSLGAVCVIAYLGRMLMGEQLLANGAQSMIFVELARDLFDGNVDGYVKSVAKELGADFKVSSFIRFEKGEGLEKRNDNFADEVASMM
jgi:hypothetical protein